MKILITDSLFIHKEHEDKLAQSGISFERLDKPQATEEEIISAIKDKDGYILGGIEKTTDKIIDAGEKLKAIVFTGIGYKDFIPNYDYVTSKNIAIANTPDAPTHAVAEWAITMALAMNRNIFDLSRTGEKSFITSKGLEAQNIGIVGFGRIGKEIARMLEVFRPAQVSYYSRIKHNDLNITYKELPQLLAESDVVFVCVSKDAGESFIGRDELSQMKNGALLVSFAGHEIVNKEALLEQLQSGRIRAVVDNKFENEDFKSIPLNIYQCFNASNAFNTETELKLCSDMATESMINLLKNGKDKNKVN